LVQLYFTEVSPRALFDQPPLCYCCPETLGWLPVLVHERWRLETGADQALEELERSLGAASATIGELRDYCERAGVSPATGFATCARSSRSAVANFTMRLSALPAFRVPYA
jgi:hypothetical protein